MIYSILMLFLSLYTNDKGVPDRIHGNAISVMHPDIAFRPERLASSL